MIKTRYIINKTKYSSRILWMLIAWGYLGFSNAIIAQVKNSPINDTHSVSTKAKTPDTLKFAFEDNIYVNLNERSLHSPKISLGFFNGLFYGVLGIQFIFFFLLFLIERDIIHFYFSMIVLGSIIIYISYWATFDDFILFPILETKAYVVPVHLFGLSLVAIGFVKFTETFFNYYKNNISNYWIPIFLLVGLLQNIVGIFGVNVIVLVQIYLIIGILFSLFIAVNAPIQKGVLKRFYFFAFIPPSICVFLLIIMAISVNLGFSFEAYDFFFEHLNKFMKGSLIILLTALAIIIGHRTNILKADQQLAIQLAEKNSIVEAQNAQNELLLKEIHHRVKNNLQTISSLLSLQSNSIKDANALDAVQESRNRVGSMALIHQKLYQGENLAAIEMRDYFETIGATIINSFGAKANEVELEVDMAEIELDVDTAIPVGLITNELLTNSLKYAFTKKDSGKISISMVKDENNLIQLSISDNGINESNKISDSRTGFGTLLINLLTTQLGGQLEQTINDGTATIIKFSLNKEAA